MESYTAQEVTRSCWREVLAGMLVAFVLAPADHRQVVPVAVADGCVRFSKLVAESPLKKKKKKKQLPERLLDKKKKKLNSKRNTLKKKKAWELKT
jgi:hypothetical protein